MTQNPTQNPIYDWPAIVYDLNALLKLRSIPFGMKMFARREDIARHWINNHATFTRSSR